MSRFLLVNASQVVTCAGPAGARRGGAMADAAPRERYAVAVRDDRIDAVGLEDELLRAYPDADRVDCARGLLAPGFVDSHTHAIFGRHRAAEQELRAAGMEYMEIARRGGGIHASVSDLRAHSEDELYALARGRLRTLARSGVTTVEIKSGYGLSVDDELKMLRVIRRLAADLPLRIVPTFLGAHEVPVEHRGSATRRRDYINMLIGDLIPRVGAEGLAVFADVFCETHVYTAAESREILAAARRAGLKLKLHADELTSSGGAELAAELEATSADHLAAVSAGGIAALAAARTVATLLPATMTFLGKTAQAPARRLIEAGVPVALATDFNPGTSPTLHFPTVLTLGVSQLHLSAAEAVVAGTVNGAAALALADSVGQLAPGFSADLALFDAEDYRELPYWFGAPLCRRAWVRGKPCDW
ncbi:MAG: imidazolonepropionase [Gemmatimonadaceae bacterium]|nr:imidazolonepropionase [Gemmatimonadaceae bacterium]